MSLSKKGAACPVNSNAGTVLYSLRLYRGLSHDDIAQMLGTSAEQIKKYETGAEQMPVTALYHLARYFKISVMDFFAGLEDTASPADHLWLSRDELKVLRLWRNIHDDRMRGHMVRFMQDLARKEDQKAAL